MVPKEEINKRRSTLLLILSIIAATLLLLWVILYFDSNAGGDKNQQSMYNHQIKYSDNDVRIKEAGINGKLNTIIIRRKDADARTETKS